MLRAPVLERPLRKHVVDPGHLTTLRCSFPMLTSKDGASEATPREPSMETVPRTQRIEADQFVTEYIAQNRPVIITDSMRTWAGCGKWNPSFFRDRFGDALTLIYDNLFTLRDVRPLREYIDRYFGKQEEYEHVYARCYAKFKAVDFHWFDAVFDALAQDWSHPYFLPTTSYVMPLCRPPETVLANRNVFPYKGLFISPRGARTRLHRDPYGTDAILCQFFGTKRLALYHPSDDGKVRKGTQFVDPKKPDRRAFPDFTGVQPVYEDELRPGEVLFIPSGWFHDVVSVTDSISITWNFVHAAHRGAFLREIGDPANKFDRDMLDFFFSGGAGRKVSVDEMTRFAHSVEDFHPTETRPLHAAI